MNSGSAHLPVIHSFNFLLERLEAVMPSAARRGLLSSPLLGATESGEEKAGETSPQVASKQVAHSGDCLPALGQRRELLICRGWCLFFPKSLHQV